MGVQQTMITMINKKGEEKANGYRALPQDDDWDLAKFGRRLIFGLLNGICDSFGLAEMIGKIE